MKTKNLIKSIISLALIPVMAMGMAACDKTGGTISSGNTPVQSQTTHDVSGVLEVPLSENLMDGFKAETVAKRNTDQRFISAHMRLAAELFKASVENSKKENKNVLVSPLSLQLALAMTANGANGNTLKEMEAVLGGDMNISELNEYLRSYVDALPSDEKSKLSIANSIWFRDEEQRLSVNRDFLQTNANYYDAQAYKLPFNDDTLKKINGWVNEHTDGMIKEILDQIDYDTVMYLINALTFDAEWQNIYETSQVGDSTFNAIDGSKQNIKMMYSEESYYLSDGKAEGFIRPYKDNKYSFAALLPNKDIDLYDYIETLDAEQLQNTINNAAREVVFAGIPKFSYDYDIDMTEMLKEMGMPLAFDETAADFSKLGKSSNGNLYIGSVIQKTFIAVDERGTKAGAATIVDVKDEAMVMTDHTIYLDRPFVYMILDNSTNLPVFIGAVTKIS